MKKIIVILLAVISIYLVYNEVNADTIIIPDNAIRIRVIPNSNTIIDQKIKNKVKNYLEENFFVLLKDASSIEEARYIINNNINDIEKNINNIFIENEYNNNFTINFGYNYFPEKDYKGIKYEEGYYESLVVSIGEAKGDNWWCVLFPTLCLIDTDNLSNAEYKLWISEMLNK